MNILITGNAGFIGMHLTLYLINLNHNIIGIDNINDYYDTRIKFDRLKECGILESQIEENIKIQSSKFKNFSFIKMDLINYENLNNVFKSYNFDYVIHLAAQAGVRYSLTHPEVYIKNNIVSFFNIIDNAKNHKIKHFIYASSSSVYGNSSIVPFDENMLVDKPESLYAATKKSNELIAYTYSSTHHLKTTGLRFFTVYGPWGRPDMAYFKFTESIFQKQPIKIFNNGKLSRDFTYIDDIINGISRIVFNSDFKDNYDIFNIGNNNPIQLMTFVETLEKIIGQKAIKNFIEMQAGDVLTTYANINKIHKLNYTPEISIESGLQKFVSWYTSYYKLN